MKPSLMVGAVAGALAGVAAFILKETFQRQRPAAPSVLLMGDSHAQGLHMAGLGQLAAADGVPYAAVYQVGTTVHHWSGALLDQALAQYQPTVVVVSLGNNETAVPNPSEDFQRSTSASTLQFAQKVHAAGAYLVYLQSPKLPWSTEWAAARWREVSDSTMPGSAFDDEPRGDGIHLLGSGYKRWGEAVWAWLYSERFR